MLINGSTVFQRSGNVFQQEIRHVERGVSHVAVLYLLRLTLISQHIASFLDANNYEAYHTVCGKKKYPLKFCAIFLATARNFYMKFHTFVTHS